MQESLFPARHRAMLAPLALACILALGLAGAPVARAQASGTAQVVLNMPSTLSAPVVPGVSRVTLPFELGEATRLSLDVIVPVDGARITLLAPDGRTALSSGQAGVVFHPGAELPQPSPGGVFELGPLEAPADGRWQLVIDFPAAAYSTVIMATARAISPIQAGIALERSTVLVGEDVSIGMLLTKQGQPLLGLSPRLSVSRVGDPAAPAQPAQDDGRGPDGLANDGLYSIDHTFDQAGEYLVRGEALVPGAKGPVLRQASQRVKVVEPSLTRPQIQLGNVLGSGGCVSGLQVQLGFDAASEGEYAARLVLSNASGQHMETQKALNASGGRANAALSFNAREIKSKLGASGPYTLSLVEVLGLDGEELLLAYRRADAGNFTLPAAGLCTQPIELPGPLSVSPVLKSGFIGALDITIPVQVTVSGFYQISYKVFGANGEDLGLINASRNLGAGPNQVSMRLNAEQLLNSDGPYRISSLLVVGGGRAERQSLVGESAAYTRWQFHPRISGDLNGDGSVDEQDNAIITQFRNLKAAVPGDRRDLNRDGVINLLDARALQKLACKAPNCPVIP